MSYGQALLAALLALDALAVPAVADDDRDDDHAATKHQGEFATLPDGTAMGPTIEGVAKIERTAGRSRSSLNLWRRFA